MAALDIRPVAYGAPEWAPARAIRQRVFVEEQACPPDEEWDAADADARHFVLLVDDEPVATARWRPAEHEGAPAAKLERFAVLPEFRSRGLGLALVAAVMADAEAAGFDRQVLHAQAHLEGFYRTFGFRRSGPDFWEAGLLHTPMARTPKPAAGRAAGASRAASAPGGPAGRR